MTDKPDKPTTPATSPTSSAANGPAKKPSSDAGSRANTDASGTASSGNASGSAARNPAPPRPAVSRSGDGYPEVDTLSFDPEDGDWVGQTRRWVEQNPVLAVAAAAAGGLLLGRIVSALIPDPEPKTFSEKVEIRARELADHSRDAAADAGEVVSKQLAIAADALSEASKAVAKNAKKGYDDAKDFGAFLAETVGQTVADRAAKWLDKR